MPYVVSIEIEKMRIQLEPPMAIGSDRVIAYAHVDKSVIYTGKQNLYVDGTVLKKVPCIAICKSLKSDFKDYLVLYCDTHWKVCGVTGKVSLAAAKAEVERCYAGISSRWVKLNNPEKLVRLWIAREYPEHVCSFCGKPWFDVETMFSSKSAVLCSSCVDVFSLELASWRKKSLAN